MQAPLSRLCYRCKHINAVRHFSASSSSSSSTTSPHITKLVSGVLAGNRRALSRSVTLLESSKEEHHQQAQDLLSEVLANADQERVNNSFRVGISGPPGAGKSTFIEALGMHLVGEGHRVAVLAIDPSSTRTYGSILGDKTRMQFLSAHDQAFIRPSPTRGALGGVAQYTGETLMLCEAAGYDVLLVETVGVGQSEVAVNDIVDMALLVLPPASGDELQGIKKGIVELADLIVVNKADGDLSIPARRTRLDYKSALNMLRPKYRDWAAQATTCSSINGPEGVAKVWAITQKFRETMRKSGALLQRRSQQRKHWLWQQVHQQTAAKIRSHQKTRQLVTAMEHDVMSGKAAPRWAADKIIEVFFSKS